MNDTTQSLPRATKRNSETICGQLWHFRTSRYWSNDTLGGSTERCIDATRYSDGRTCCGGSRERLVAIIAERITNGIY